AGAGIATRLAALIALRIAQPIRLGIEQSVQRFLHGPPHHPLEVALDPFIVNRDDIVSAHSVYRLTWRLPLAGLVAFSHLQFSQIRGRQPYLIVRKILYVIKSEGGMIVLLTRLFLLACLLASPAALAQTYPDRNVTIVVTSAAGALTDVLTRAVAQRLSETWKQSVIVENRGGAGYSIAAQSVLRAEHDGYTLLASETGFYTTQPHLYAKDKLPYDAEK